MNMVQCTIFRHKSCFGPEASGRSATFMND